MIEEGISSARDYLNSTGLRYLGFINGVSQESLVQRTRDLSPLLRCLPSPRRLVSIGVGQGEEIHALSELYSQTGLQIIGVDISDLALRQTQQRIEDNKLPALLVCGSATDLPFQANSIGGIVLSSLMHEVYSYFPSGFKAWNQTIRGSARVLEEGGCLFLRDSAAPDFVDYSQISFKTELALKFYEYFRTEFRAFSSWDKGLREQFNPDQDLNRKNLPPVDEYGRVVLSQRYGAELLLHFFTFWKGYIHNVGRIGNINWKEINEAYYLPDPSDISIALPQSEYIEEVLGKANQELENQGFKMVCIEGGESVRPNTDKVIDENFDVQFVNQNGNPKINSTELTPLFSKKMELVFKKVKL